MSSFNCKTVKVKRLPFTDTTNFTPNSIVIPRRRPGRPPKTSTDHLNCTPNLSVIPKRLRGRTLRTQTDHLISSDPKCKLQLKVCDKTNNPQTIHDDPKFKLITKVNLQRLVLTDRELRGVWGCDERIQNLSVIRKRPRAGPLKTQTDNLISSGPECKLQLKLCDKTDYHQTILNDPKFKSVAKVYLQRLVITDGILRELTGVWGCDERMQNNGLIRTNHVCTSPANLHENSKPEPRVDLLTSLRGRARNNKENNKTKNYDRKGKLVSQVSRCTELEKSLNHDKHPEFVKNVRFADNVVTKDKALRKRRSVNYTELSFRDSFEQKQDTLLGYQEHVPVYLQNVYEQPGKEKDPFEFTCNSPTKKRYKGRPRKKVRSPLHRGEFKKRTRGRPRVKIDSDSDSDQGLYDKSMRVVLQEVRKKVGRTKIKNYKRGKHNGKQPANCLKPENNVRGNIELVVSHTRNTKQKLSKNSQGLISNITVVPRNLHNEIVSFENETAKQDNANNLGKENKNRNGLRNDLISNLESERTRTNIDHSEAQTDECDIYFGFDDDCQDSDDDIANFAPIKTGPNTLDTFCKLNPIAENAFNRLTSLTSTPLPNGQRLNLKVAKPPNQANNSNKINIISNVVIPPQSQQASIQTEPTMSKLRSGNNQSTPASYRVVRRALGSRTSDKISSPWRGSSLRLKRNPHFLQLKDTSSLPRYNQEMIIEPKLDERLSILKRPVQNEELINLVQTSILDYVSSDLQSTPIKKSHNRTLFDEGDFSPIQSNDNKESTSKTGDANNVIRSQNLDGKRNLFGTPRSIKKNQCLPLRPRNNQDGNINEELGVQNYFGFDLLDDSFGNNKENNRLTRSKARNNNKRNENDIPMRVDLKQLKKVQNEAINVLLDKMNFKENVAEEPTLQPPADDALHTTELQDDTMHVVGIFEDLEEVKPAQRVYVSKRTRRARIPSVHSEDSQELAEEKPKRKRKDMRTQIEEEEFEKWAAQFNAMCEEVDKHSLETT